MTKDYVIVMFTVGPSMPPTNLTESIQDSSTIIFNWDQPNGRHNGMIREYRVNITEVETGRMFQVVSATTNLVVSNLHPYYTYEWIVTAFTVSEGPYSNTSSVTTPEDGRYYNLVATNNYSTSTI